jgi:hypothetical protein
LTRRLGNIEGAFPLLLIGSALLVYAAIIANQELATKGSHLPLWGLIAGVGAVIVGSGVYSVFLNPSVPPAPVAPEGFVMVPKAEWESSRSAQRASARTKSTVPPHTTSAPPWWEGPQSYPGIFTVRTTSPNVTHEATRPAPVPLAKVPRHPPLTSPPSQGSAGGGAGPAPATHLPPGPSPASGPTPPAPRRASLNELKEALTELEALVNNDVKPAARRLPKASPEETPSCVDCGRSLRADRASNRCAGCGRRLCAECTSSSRLEYGDLRCLECGMRPV